jgi:hypothetical protein
MSRNFVVGIDDVSDEQKRALREYFATHGSLWNWIPNFWLVMTDEDSTASAIRDRICEIAPGANCMVVQVDQGTWSGYGPSGKRRNMFKWIHNKWGTVQDEE